MSNLSKADQKLKRILDSTPLLPIFGIDSIEHVVPTVQALIDGGVKAVEFTFRFPNACDVIRKTKENFPELFVGAGTVFDLNDFKKAQEAGADFIVSPGFNKEVSDECNRKDIPYLACATTGNEVMNSILNDHRIIKFFPAESIGGLNLIDGILKAYPDIYFFATGGVPKELVSKYLSHPNVLGVSGGFLTPKKSIQNQDLNGLKENIKNCLALI